ncbi:MAG: hypothetical protein MHMPM18_004115, partial [Marteilia pararefringens]
KYSFVSQALGTNFCQTIERCSESPNAKIDLCPNNHREVAERIADSAGDKTRESTWNRSDLLDCRRRHSSSSLLLLLLTSRIETCKYFEQIV